MGEVNHVGYFVSCTQESGDGKHAIWSLEKAMQTYWRVRTWKFTGSGVFRTYDVDDDGTDVDDPFSTTIEGITSTDPDGNTITEESNLVCPSGFYVSYPGLVYDQTYAEIGFDLAKKVGDLYDSGIGGYLLDGNNGFEYLFSPNRNPILGSVSILGATVPMDAAFAFQDEDEVTQAVVSVSGTLTPTLWWSYGGTYDTATGARL